MFPLNFTLVVLAETGTAVSPSESLPNLLQCKMDELRYFSFYLYLEFLHNDSLKLSLGRILTTVCGPNDNMFIRNTAPTGVRFLEE